MAGKSTRGVWDKYQVQPSGDAPNVGQGATNPPDGAIPAPKRGPRGHQQVAGRPSITRGNGVSGGQYFFFC